MLPDVKGRRVLDLGAGSARSANGPINTGPHRCGNGEKPDRSEFEHGLGEDQGDDHGRVYLLPGVGFEREPAEASLDVVFESHHLACLEAVRPAFRVGVGPGDFPLLDRIHAYDQDVLEARSELDPHGFPWLDDS